MNGKEHETRIGALTISTLRQSCKSGSSIGIIPGMNARSCLSAGILLVPLLSPAGGARVCVEAETATPIEPPMLLVSQAAPPAGITPVTGATAGAYLEIPEGRGNPPKVNAGKAILVLDLPAEGAFTLWCRVYWEGECSNSFNVQIDERPVFLFGEDATFKTWHWVRYPVARTATPMFLSRGRHTLAFINREDGVRLDQVLLSADKRFVPVDQELAGTQP